LGVGLGDEGSDVMVSIGGVFPVNKLIRFE
jgi:hypothetical protein